jgi:threonine synthase
MKFYSTNSKHSKVSFKVATMQGLPKDNGLYMPEYIPDCTSIIKGISSLSLQDISFLIAEKYLSEDFSNADIEQIVDSSITFSAPIVKLDNSYILELFHGPTLAFKDFGASFMARTFEKLVVNNNKHLNILVATSGDTGSAVANGFYGVEGINVIILYPSNKISKIQEKQISTLDKNIYSLEVDGTFDDCQKLVKQAFLNDEINTSILLSSANSINISRLIPQSFYYFYAYSQLQEKNPVIFSVPSGNFGNLTAGVFSKYMGLPIKKFIAATNFNDTVPRFLKTGLYNPKPSIETMSNAMDVGNPSNMRRILDVYKDLELLRNDISSWSFDDNQTKEQILNTIEKDNYILDPHSAVALLGVNKFLKDNKTNNPSIFLGTAHPSKFSDVIEPMINTSIKIPSRLKNMINKEKRSIKINNDFKDFSDYLLSNFK